jgi:putative ABC transport system permease protein
MINLQIFLRRFKNDKTFSLLVIAGLSLAFCVAIPLVCKIRYHLSFDRFHPSYEKIYHVYCNEVYHGTRDVYGELPLAFGEYILKLYPEVESMTQTKDRADVLVSKDKNNTWKEDVLWVEPSFKDIFGLELLSGNKNTFLSRPNDAYICESLSRKIFGDVNSMGKGIKVNDIDYVIAGVFKDYPLNSHQKFSMLVPLGSYSRNDEKSKWDNYEFLTYIKLKDKVNAKNLETKLPSFISGYWIPWIKKSLKQDYVFSNENSIKLQLLPLSDIHLQGSFISSFEKESNFSVIYLNMAIVLALLIIAYFNMLGFAISKGKKQQSQMSIKRYLGISRSKLIRTFVYDNLGYTIIAFTISLLVTFVLFEIHPQILSGLDSISIVDYMLPVTMLFLLAIAMAIIIGFIPGIFFSRINLRTKSKTISYSGFWLNRVMLVCQMAASVILLVSVSMIFKQLNYISKFHVEIDTKNVMIINHANRIRNTFPVFKEELKKSALVKEVSRSNSYPFNWMSNESYTYANSKNQVPYPFPYFAADIGFQEVLNFELKKGRWFSEELSSDKTSIILNEAAAEVMGLKNPIGETFYKTLLPTERYHVIGVVSNFNYQSLHHQVAPLLLCPLSENDGWNFIEIKGTTSDRSQLLATVKKAWDNASGSTYLDYHFLEDKMALLYEKEQKAKQSIGIFSLIAILISCFGLLGTVLNTTTEKTKEIGIRKVNGARVIEILAMLNGDFVKWVTIAIVVACPVAWYVMHQWLQNFAYKTELSWWVFAAAGITALMIALLTVSWQSWKDATRNPVEALRYG